MFIIMVVVFVLGYLAIALEHPLRVDKAAPALIIGTLLWVLNIFGAIDMEKIDFLWYMKKISLLALLGYLTRAGVYYLQAQLVGH